MLRLTDRQHLNDMQNLHMSSAAGSGSRRPHIEVPEVSASAPPSPADAADELVPTFGELLGQSPSSQLQRKGSDKAWHRCACNVVAEFTLRCQSCQPVRHPRQQMLRMSWCLLLGSC